MSAASARRFSVATAPQFSPQRTPDLRVIEGLRPRKHVALIAVLILSMLVVSIMVPMFLNIRMAQTAYAIREQQLILNEYQAQAWTMQEEIQRKSSATVLEEAARKQGLVPASRPGFINLEQGTVEGGVAAQ